MSKLKEKIDDVGGIGVILGGIALIALLFFGSYGRQFVWEHTCGICGKWKAIDTISIEGNEEMRICLDCRDNKVFYCDDCWIWFYMEDFGGCNTETGELYCKDSYEAINGGSLDG